MDDPRADQRIAISFVLCSRNDQFQGDSLWRLGTTLNYLARQLASLDRLERAEVIVADWGSVHPLRDATVLTEEALSIVRFLSIPPELAAEKQMDSPFAEVIAINAAARRARGDYIGRIDQDTLVGRKFLRWFFGEVEHPTSTIPINSAAMITNRRRIPFHFAVRTPSFPIVERYADVFGHRFLPRMKQPPRDRYWECFIGIIVFHRDIWEECEGYDESFIYYGYMEFDFFLRVLMKHPGIDVGRIVGQDFYHLDHVPAWLLGRKQARRINPIRRSEDNPPESMQPNGPGWGLASHELPLEHSPGLRVLRGDESRWSSRAHRAELVKLTAISTVRTVVQLGRDYSVAVLGKAAARLSGSRARIPPQAEKTPSKQGASGT